MLLPILAYSPSCTEKGVTRRESRYGRSSINTLILFGLNFKHSLTCQYLPEKKETKIWFQMKWWIKKEYFHTYSDTFPLVFQIVNIKLRANGRIIFDQQLPTLFGVTCWVRLQTLLHVVAQSLKPVKFLAPCKRTQHCRPTIPNVVGGTTCNRVRNRTQHVSSNDVWSCWRTMFRPFSRGFRGLWFEFNSSSYHC